MNRNNLLILAILMLSSLLLSACALKPAVASKIPPAKVETIEGTKLKRLILIPEAAKRLDIQTAMVREESIVRTRKFGGKVITMPIASTVTADPDKVLVRVSLSESDLKDVARAEPAIVLPLTNLNPKTNGPAPAPAPGLTATLVEKPAVPNADPATELYYAIDQAKHSLTNGQAVYLQLVLTNNGAPRKIVPFSAVIYDKDGNAWTYTNPDPLVFIRQPIKVEYFEGDQAILTEGPAAGTVIVTAGASELFGAEVGVGK